MRASTRFLAFALAISIPVLAGNPVDIHGRLQVAGNRIIGQKSGDTVQLTGMSLFWHEWMGQYYNAKTVDWLVDDWRCSILRAAVGADFSDGGIASPGDISGGRKLAEAVVEAGSNRGIYTIVDWHSHHAPKHVADAKGFFDTVASKYGDNPGVIFEIFNEPWANDYSWKEIKAYAEAVIPVIRKHSKNLILVGTRQWSRDVDEASLDPIVDSNLAYVIHFYAGSHRDTLRARARTALANGVALFVSEWGTTNEDGGTVDKNIYPGPTDEWFAWMDSNKISSCNWSVQNKGEAAAILKPSVSKLFGWNDSDLTASGLYAKAAIRARNTSYSFDPPPVDSTKLPGRIEAESFSDKADLSVNGPGDDDNSPFLGNSKVGSWAEFKVANPRQKKAVMALRVATADSSAKVVVKVNGSIRTTLAFKGTGGWGKFGTVKTDSFLLGAGDLKIRIEWNGLFDLNWLDISGRMADGQIPVEVDTTPVAVRVEAESFTSKNSMTLESSEDDATQSLGWTYDTSWAEYQANLRPGKQVVAFRTASASKGATLRLKVNGNKVADVKIPGSGGWKTWQTIVSDSIDLAGGDTKLRLEWILGSNQDGLVNLNWFEFRSRPVVAILARAEPVVGARFDREGLRVELAAPARVQVLDLTGHVRWEQDLPMGASHVAFSELRGAMVLRIRTPTGQKVLPLVRF